MKPAEILASLVIVGADCLAWPQVALALIKASRYFPDPDMRAIARGILCNGGNWRDAVRWLRGRGTVPPARLAAFEKWAVKITHRECRGLLTEGGAS